MKKHSNPIKQLLAVLLVLLILVSVYSTTLGSSKKPEQLKYSEFIQNLQEGDVSTVVVNPKSGASVSIIEGTYTNNDGEDVKYVTKALYGEDAVRQINSINEELGYKVKVKINEEQSISPIVSLIMGTVPYLLLIMIAFFFVSKNANGAGKAFDFGKSRAKLYENKKKITFNDVAGLDEEKQEISELVDFLKSPKKFEKMGARIPKGVLLVGPPGTGKTLLARSVAGEAGVPFYSISGSDFVEMFVGVGASRVRDMFKQAKQTAPCLVFIDEIDAVGRQRGAGFGGGHDEREQTLNQLLVEMDGFGENEGIIIIAATNRPDVLDPALLRPGRFDRQITVSNPDVKGREAILKVHARNKKFTPEVNFTNIAKRTPGYSGADLENLLNEAALLAVRQNKDLIDMKDIDEAADRVIMGPAKKSKKYSEAERNLVAHHEAGHVVIGLKLQSANDVHKVTIIPRGEAGGYAMMIPKEEKFLSTKTDLIERITGLLGGRAAEEIMFGEVTTGAHNDFEKATKIARAMVTEYGMSDLGPVQLEHQQGDVFLGRDYGKAKNFSDKVAHEIDQEVRKIVGRCYDDSKRILTENKELLVLIAQSLLEHETLTKEQIEHLEQYGRMPFENQGYSYESTEKEAE